MWLEYDDHENPQLRWKVVNHETASRNGEPFKALVDRKGYLPNPVTRFCTTELKIRTMQMFAKHLQGWSDWTNVIGLRADEPLRVARSRARSDKEPWDNAMPLATAGITKRDVQAFWNRQNFDLRLPNINGSTPLGNCDLCFLKSAATIQAIMRHDPATASWWIKAEGDSRASKPSGARFRQDRPSYAAMLDAVRRQQVFDFGDRDEIVDCFCGDGA